MPSYILTFKQRLQENENPVELAHEFEELQPALDEFANAQIRGATDAKLFAGTQLNGIKITARLDGEVAAGSSAAAPTKTRKKRRYTKRNKSFWNTRH